VIRAEEE